VAKLKLQPLGDRVVVKAVQREEKTKGGIVLPDTAKDKRAGVDAAQAYLDQNKADLAASYNDIKNIRGFQVKDETMKKLADSVLASGTKVGGLKIKYMSESMADKELDQKLDILSARFATVKTIAKEAAVETALAVSDLFTGDFWKLLAANLAKGAGMQSASLASMQMRIKEATDAAIEKRILRSEPSLLSQ
jgi:hypothetical protein